MFKFSLGNCERRNDGEVGEADRIRSRRSKDSSLSFEKVLLFFFLYEQAVGERTRGEGLLLYGNKCPLRSPRPERGVGIRLISRANKLGGGMRIGAGLLLASGIEDCREVLLTSMVKSFGARAVVDVGRHSSGTVQRLPHWRLELVRMEPRRAQCLLRIGSARALVGGRERSAPKVTVSGYSQKDLHDGGR